MSRRLARESAIKFLYSTDFNKTENLEDMMQEFFESEKENLDDQPQDPLNKNDIRFAEEIIKGAIENLEHIDQLIQGNTIGWAKERIAKVDLAILRVVAEYVPDTA
jgi:transcription termination factor NusB